MLSLLLFVGLILLLTVFLHMCYVLKMYHTTHRPTLWDTAKFAGFNNFSYVLLFFFLMGVGNERQPEKRPVYILFSLLNHCYQQFNFRQKFPEQSFIFSFHC